MNHISPYQQYAELVLGNYNAGDALRSYVINLYSGRPCDLSRVRTLDSKHRLAFVDILHGYLAAHNETELVELVAKIHMLYPSRYC